MKKPYLFLLLVCLLTISLVACASSRDQYIRIHIRANSDNAIDQETKLEVRDAIIAYLAPYANSAKDKSHMMRLINDNIQAIKVEADKALKANNVNYYAEVELSREVFPTKTYGDLTLKSGEYDALIINLGEGTGGNWWCVAFPPLCFIPTEEDIGEEIVYKSKIAEWLSSIFN